MNKTFESLAKELQRAKDVILKLSENWDGEQSKSYTKDTWDRCAVFLQNLFQNFWDLYQQILPTPTISPGIEGDIDIEWRTDKFQLLLSIPANLKESISLYGDNYKDEKIKGIIELQQIDIKLLAWLNQMV